MNGILSQIELYTYFINKQNAGNGLRPFPASLGAKHFFITLPSVPAINLFRAV